MQYFEAGVEVKKWGPKDGRYKVVPQFDSSVGDHNSRYIYIYMVYKPTYKWEGHHLVGLDHQLQNYWVRWVGLDHEA